MGKAVLRQSFLVGDLYLHSERYGVYLNTEEFKKELNDTWGKLDKIFVTLVAPIAFLITISWSFYFYRFSWGLATIPENIITQENIFKAIKTAYSSYGLAIFYPVIFFISSILFWVASVSIKKELSLVTNVNEWRIRVTTFLKFVTVYFLLCTILFIPIFLLRAGSEYSVSVSIILIILVFLVGRRVPSSKKITE